MSQYDDDVAAYAALTAQRNHIDEELDAIKERLRKLGIGKHEGPGGTTVVIAENRRFDPSYAAETLPPDLLALCTVEKVDAKAAKHNLPPVVYEGLMREVGEYRVSVK